MALKQRQVQLLEAIMANPMITDIELAEEFQINRNTVREWKRKPEFVAELKERLRQKWQDSEAIAVETMQTLSRNGDYKASKYILDSLGYAPTQKIEASVATTVIEVSVDDE